MKQKKVRHRYYTFEYLLALLIAAAVLTYFSGCATKRVIYNDHYQHPECLRHF
jgi:hypothetical protein